MSPLRYYSQIKTSFNLSIREYELQISSGDYFGDRTKLWSVRHIGGFEDG
jgi:hypothetical protein